jgi:hypothetical protein
MMKKEVAMEDKEGKGDEVGKSEFLWVQYQTAPELASVWENLRCWSWTNPK